MELAAIHTLKGVTDWIAGSAAVCAGLRDTFGIEDAGNVRTLARMTRPDYDAVVTLVVVNNGTADVPPTPVQQSQIGMVWESVNSSWET